MSKNHLFKNLLVILAVAVSSQAWGANVSLAEARRSAASYIQQKMVQGMFKARKTMSADNLTLAYAEASLTNAEANDYYAFNVQGGGWIIISGEDRTTTVLGYSDRGNLDFNRIPCTVKSLLSSYKREIEYVRAHKGDDLMPAAAPPPPTMKNVDPLITSTWGQEMPYYLQCPIYKGEYCVVGCVATAMAQVMRFWQYPQSCESIPSYYCYEIGKTVNALPATTFDYSLMLDSYCHWDWGNGELVQDAYTDEQAQEVAKLSRYCGQAVEMSYSPEGSGAYTYMQLEAMKEFGYRSSAEYVQKSGWWSSGYTTAEWEAMIKAELDAGRPILYAANDPEAGGHAFICDGYRADGMFHFNMGWYGTCDGWYVSTALNMTHRDGDELRFNSGHEMLIGVEPPEGWEPPTQLQPGDINGDGVVDIGDVNAVINIMLGKAQAEEYLGNPDTDNNGTVDIGDVNAVINIMLGKE